MKQKPLDMYLNVAENMVDDRMVILTNPKNFEQVQRMMFYLQNAINSSNNTENNGEAL